ncbi:ABC transporter permease [Roseovarius sp. EL26]|uniref:ABC transporter permease n=1 Tax=Roseovarius sp. EL26 TaxID=2126672 RepID=UPI000EA23A7A|nr:ABC transporter permease [Roseovarius sp. EL26]
MTVEATETDLRPPLHIRLIQVFAAMWRQPSGKAGLTLLFIHLFVAVFAGLLVSHNFAAQDAAAIFAKPSAEHWLGADNLGRDVLTRTMLGGRPALITTFFGTMLALLLGGFLGILLGFIGGTIDDIAMRVVDAFLAIPWLLLLLLIVAIFGTATFVMVLTLGFLYAVAIIRIIRAATLDVVAQDYITAARTRGERKVTIVIKELLPNVLDVVLVEGAMRWSWMLLTFSALSFLGFGVTPPTPDWGLMIASSRNFMSVSVWPVAAPMIALSTLIIGLNLSADALAKALGVDRARIGG